MVKKQQINMLLFELMLLPDYLLYSLFLGKPSYDQCHPDYIPTIFSHKRSNGDQNGKAKLLIYEKRMKREAQKKKVIVDL